MVIPKDTNYVIDAIDTVSGKIPLIRSAQNLHIPIISSMGAAMKLDPARIRVAEFWKVQGDPLARALRNRFKRAHTFPARKFACVFSDEPPALSATEGKGSLVHITAIFGNMLASLVVRDICRLATSDTTRHE